MHLIWHDESHKHPFEWNSKQERRQVVAILLLSVQKLKLKSL
jgi:hypothetical protein